jgi:protein-S-isoprenylcysteine O-methyltransferase Ste14
VITGALQQSHDLSHTEAFVIPVAAVIALLASVGGYVAAKESPAVPNRRRATYGLFVALFIGGVAASIAVDRACDGFKTGSATRTWIGNVIALAAALWLLFATVSIGKDFSGRTIKKGAGLRRDRAFAVVRHPLYLGWALLAFAPVLAISWAYLLEFLPFLAFLYWQARQEELELRGALAPGEYSRYRRRTRAKIVPGDQLLHP